MELEGVVFFKPKLGIRDENFNVVETFVVEIGGEWGGWNDGFRVPVEKLTSKAIKVTENVTESEEVAVKRITYSTEWYDELILDCRHIIEKMEFDFLKGKWMLANRIKKDWSKLDVSYGEITKTKSELARDLGLRTRELYELIKFAEKCPDEETFATVSQNFGSWRMVIHEYLPEFNLRKEEEKPLPLNGFQTLKSYYPPEIMSELSAYIPERSSKKELRSICKTFVQILWKLVSEREEIKRIALSRLREEVEK